MHKEKRRCYGRSHQAAAGVRENGQVMTILVATIEAVWGDDQIHAQISGHNNWRHHGIGANAATEHQRTRLATVTNHPTV